LFVHCDGRVSAQYLQVCTENGCSVDSGISVGDQLEVTKEYFEKAYECIYEIGIKIAHVIWRRQCPEQLVKSDDNINKITYGLIENAEYDLAIRLLDFFAKMKKHSDETMRRTMVVNRAQAYKWATDKEKCQEILNAEDWSACEDKFKLCVAVLREDFTAAYRCMKKLKEDGEFHRVHYKDWPIFQELRRQPDFSAVYVECYGEPFTTEKTTAQEPKG